MTANLISIAEKINKCKLKDILYDVMNYKEETEAMIAEYTNKLSDIDTKIDNTIEFKVKLDTDGSWKVFYDSKLSDSLKNDLLNQLYSVRDALIDPDIYSKYGEVSSKGQYVCGFTSPGGDANWPVEDGWHITAVNKTTYKGEVWYDCYYTDDGDHYGWIKDDYIYFY